MGRGRRRMLQRLLALWAPRARLLVLARVEEEGDAGEAGEDRKAQQEGIARVEALHQHWAPVFERGAEPEEARRLRAARLRLNTAGQSLGVMIVVLRRASDNVPRLDGLRQRVWRAGGHTAVATLHTLMCAFLADEPVPEEFAVAMLIFLPKGEVAGEGARLGRKAVATRPLGLRNADAKVFHVAVAHSLSQSTSRGTLGMISGGSRNDGS